MLKNYIKIAFRNITQHKAFSFINIFGLAVGMAGTILISLFIFDELSYDNYHENVNNIYRLERKGNFQGKEYHSPRTAHPMGATLVTDFEEIENSVRIMPVELMVKDKNNTLNEETIYFADNSLLQAFTFPLINGNPENSLIEPNSMVISKEMSHKYFGNVNPLNEHLNLQWGDEQLTFKITGVMENIPANSHFNSGFFVSYSTLNSLLRPGSLDAWFSHFTYTYLYIKENANLADLKTKFPAFMEKYLGTEIRKSVGPDTDINELVKLHLCPINEIYLYSKLSSDIQPQSDITRVYIFSAIALLILVIAGINFMNLSTARSARRAKEVGMRKVSGANRAFLIRQFLGESLFLSFISFLLAIVMVEIALPAFNAFTQKELVIHYFTDAKYIFGFISLVLFVGIFSGSYPAFFLSKFKPAAVLKSSQSSISGSRSPLLRKILVVGQFAVSIALIICTFVVIKQMSFLKKKNMGFDKEQVLVIPCRDESVFNKLNLVKSDLTKNPAVTKVSGCAKIPGDRFINDSIYKKDGDNDETVLLCNYAIDEEYIPTMGIKMAAGRNFSKKFVSDATEGYLINEAAAKKMGWQNAEEAIGKRLGRPVSSGPVTYRYKQIIGVVKNFNFKSLHNEIEPLLMYLNNRHLYYVTAKINTENIAKTVQSIEKTWKSYSQQYPFEYFFLDDNFNRLYLAEERTQNVFTAFSFLAIFIASLGLFGMASFTTEQRTKEIGVRKVMGASITSIIVLLSKEFTKWVLIANIIAWPIGYWVMTKWLQNFNYQVEMGIGLFLMAMIITMGIAIGTVSYQAVKAAIANPIESLKYE